MPTASELVDQSIEQFDVTRTRALSYLNERYRRMIAEARWVPSSTASTGVTDVFDPTDLTDSTGAAGTPVIPEDLHQYLRDGLVSDLYLHVDERPDLAELHEQRFVEGVAKLRQRKSQSGATFTAAGILDAYVTAFNDSRANGLAFLNARYSQMVVDAHYFTREASLGATVAGQSDYTLPAGVEDIRSLYVSDRQYVPVSMEAIRSLEDPDSDNYSSQPVFAEEYGPAGEIQVRLWPTPETGGTEIMAVTSGAPTALTDSTGAAGTPSIPADLHLYLRHGVFADGYMFIARQPNLAESHEQMFQRGVGLLRRRKLSRVGSTSTRMQVSSGGR